MRKLFGLALVAVALTAVGCGRIGERPAAHRGSALAWESDLDGALKRAGAEKKLVMVNFYADWCRWCTVLEETTFSDGAVQAELGRLVVVKLDADREGRGAARRYRVDGFPTVVFLDPSGREVGRIPGYLPPAPFLEELGDILARA